MLRWLVLPFAVFCVGCASPESAGTPDEIEHAFDLDGTIRAGGQTIQYVVPEGYCLLDSKRPAEMHIYEKLGEDVEDDGRVFALFADCDQLETIRTTGGSAEDIGDAGGYFYMLEDDGTPMRGGMSRSGFAHMVSTEMLTSDFEDVDGDVTSTGYTDDAAFFSLTGQEIVDGNEYPMLGAAGVTLVYDIVVGAIMFRVADDPAGAAMVDEEIRALIDAFIDANPDSDT